jgi:CMP-N-acetylneuraminic acid synthetase
MVKNSIYLQLQQVCEIKERFWNRTSEVVVLQITAPTINNKNIKQASEIARKYTWNKKISETYISSSSVKLPIAAGIGPCSFFEEKFLQRHQYVPH